MKAIFSPGTSYTDPSARKYAGWIRILDLYKEALDELGFDVFVPEVPPELIDKSSTVSKITSYDLVAATQSPEDALFFFGASSFCIAQMLRLPQSCKKLVYVFNNADWYRDEMLAEEYKKFGAPYALSPVWRWINKKALEIADHVLTCSPFVKKTHSKLVPGDKISITFWGVDSEKFTPAEEEPPGFRILYVGSDHIRKGLVYLLNALVKIEGAELWMVGQPIETTGLPQVKELGMVPNSEVPDIYRQCHVQVQPTLEDGISLCVQEGMASGVPCIATADPAEVFHNGVSGIKIPYRDTKAIYDALIMLKEDPEKRREMAKQARALAEKQPWEKTKEAVKEIIGRLYETW